MTVTTTAASAPFAYIVADKSTPNTGYSQNITNGSTIQKKSLFATYT